ncbi:MAG: hypothetical protein NC453_13875 [Muribaculum sp.]|nr:hypothetical protein [Muribaculum sp.]
MRIIFQIILVNLLFLTSCEGRSGYINEDQEAVVDRLTASTWILTSEESDIFGTKTYEDESRIYKFDSNGKGWTGWGNMQNGTLLSEPIYFQWAFTPNFTVFQTTGNAVEGYWLIQKLTASDFQALWTVRDPVQYPIQDKTVYKFSALTK